MTMSIGQLTNALVEELEAAYGDHELATVAAQTILADLFFAAGVMQGDDCAGDDLQAA